MTTLTKPPTQADRILVALHGGPVCGTTLLGWGIPRYVARIWELKQRGYRITKELCRLHDHQTRQWVWRLEE
jgi:hypothetical protein